MTNMRTKRAKKELSNHQAAIKNIKEIMEIQGRDGNWNAEPYMHGLYNGLEYALSIIEGRHPNFKIAPDGWLMRDNSNEFDQVDCLIEKVVCEYAIAKMEDNGEAMGAAIDFLNDHNVEMFFESEGIRWERKHND